MNRDDWMTVLRRYGVLRSGGSIGDLLDALDDALQGSPEVLAYQAVEGPGVRELTVTLTHSLPRSAWAALRHLRLPGHARSLARDVCDCVVPVGVAVNHRRRWVLSW